MKHLTLLASMLLASASLASANQVPDNSPDPSVSTFPRPVYQPHCAGGFAIQNHAVVCTRVVSFYIDTSLAAWEANAPRPVYRPECVQQAATGVYGPQPCLRTISFKNDRPQSLALGDI